MNLIVDIGNTCIKIALFEKNNLIEKSYLRDNYLDNIKSILSKNPVENSIVSNVGEINDELISVLNENTRLVLFKNILKLPFKNTYSSKETLGQDRIALVSSASYQFPDSNVLIIDAGTCITYDFKNHNNEYIGGGISPGIKMRFKSLNLFTSKLPLIDVFDDFNLIGNNTKESLNSGVVNGTIMEINGIIQQYHDKFKNIRIILTGGDSKFLLKRIKNTIFADQNFLIKGLNYLLEANIEK
ncbi:MAG: type III pantothenate kinase [Cryomorphaceae bacterium]|nr:MAG: type III pantothenate kinase [Cryomorphaceae bacterium]